MKQNKTDLDLIIETLEAERKSLKKMIKDAAIERDNLIIYYHSEALLELERRLRVFYSFKDPYFEKKEELKRKIKFLRQIELGEKYNPKLREFKTKLYEDRATDFEKDLQQLTNIAPTTPIPGTKEIESALFALYDERYRMFKILLGDDGDDNLALMFRIKKKILTIELKNDLDGIEPDFVIDNRISQPLKAAGFEYDLQRKKYIRKFDASGLKNLQEIKMWLAKFIIEDSWFYWPGRKMRLEYKI